MNKDKDTLWNFSFRAFHEIQFHRHSMNHEILPWNIFTLLSKFPCVCLSSIKNGVFWARKFNGINFDKWYLLLIKQKQKQKNQNCQTVSEWNHGWKTATTKVHVLTYSQNIFQSISWNTVSQAFHESWNTSMKYFYFIV